MLDEAAIIDFWFKEISPEDWWKKDAAFDLAIKNRFLGIHQAASCGELVNWRQTSLGRLAEVIVLDQFSRNIYRDSPQAFAQDAKALTLAQEAIAIGAHQQLAPTMRAFLYMPFMHSESLQIHEQAEILFAEADMDVATLQFELKHKDIIERFGRYPHRNAVLGRISTEAEIAFLTEPGSAF